MPIKRVAMNISFPSQEEKEEAIAKAAERGKDVSEIVVKHFRKMKHLPRRK